MSSRKLKKPIINQKWQKNNKHKCNLVHRQPGGIFQLNEPTIGNQFGRRRKADEEDIRLVNIEELVE